MTLNITKPVCLIAAVDDVHGIGKDDEIPWHIPADLKRFKEITSKTTDPFKRNALIMGRKTWFSIPARFRPLIGRVNYVLTRNDLQLAGGKRCSSLEHALITANDDDYIESIFVIGGQSVYKEALFYAKTIYLTSVRGDFGCDVHFPEIPAKFALKSAHPVEKHDDYQYQFLIYET